MSELKRVNKINDFKKSYTAGMNSKKTRVIVDAIECREWFHLSKLIQHTKICQENGKNIKQNQLSLVNQIP